MREDPPKSQTVAEERKLDKPGNAFSPLIYSPCVPVLLEEIASLLFPPSSSPSSSSSAFSSQGGERRSQLSPFQRLKTVPAAVPACNLLSVRVFGTACCMLASSRWLLLAGLVDSAKTLVVDLSALSPSVVAATCEAVEAARRRDLETESERQEADSPVERAEPVFQFLGDAVPLAFSALSTEDRLAVLRHRGARPKSRPGKREGEEDSEERDAEGLDEQSESQQGRETQREERKGGGERRRDPRKPKRQETTEGEKQIGFLKARMCRRVDGIDVEAYMTSLYLFRKMQRDAKTQT
ncbi:hypothetical protein TGPRC2_299172 [Toxoplasma gondii TgCatPRC2]|uniref:Uncharacterized protein n=5 Tax=Toxoplasma gondii TaxID=5811 RepID=A0A125YY64_TOXGV|nr:hypothetical protein TGME49_299172 [Toxoplasma gondii ME49]ESS30405.1 hypothetical protein TGVEG_299172 [Toxoplasma gondii VEG]KFG35335.1 hypothetical protein TGDOM2_299172 [Toxoplasma gondii GAB2-2007-GAL-DOM2]KYF42071.1 hypothetical protein TGARI_299172 [Toxoplasma gondii ARI]KYK67270.1 hypothetical protein TGPRC2_299172 [Toxoplasma gondii TgCatPRC2]EPT31648.1 hypothetical protein TGME49_299172 [Toxoplasma gondii ME49]|eukprot:XP_018638102.1 hypothetical protein TGME49_299172 [Toxoplasma gondii ME49]